MEQKSTHDKPIILYAKRGCPYCQKVLNKLHEIGIDFDTRYISDPEDLGELMEHGGKRQTPYIIDQVTGAECYESDAIIAYLEKEYTR